MPLLHLRRVTSRRPRLLTLAGRGLKIECYWQRLCINLCFGKKCGVEFRDLSRDCRRRSWESQESTCFGSSRSISCVRIPYAGKLNLNPGIQVHKKYLH